MSTKVAVELMTMYSDPQYVSSSGSTNAYLVKAAEAARCGNDSDALYDLDGERIDVSQLQDVEKRTHKNGACNYTTWTGTLDVPDGMTVVQKKRLDICTRDKADYWAWVANPESLKELYEQRAKEYSALAETVRERNSSPDATGAGAKTKGEKR